MKNILISLCLALFIISASVTITLNFRPLYYHDISSLKIEETSGFSKKVIRENYDALIDYNQFFYSGKLKLTLPMSFVVFHFYNYVFYLFQIDRFPLL